MKRWLLLIVLWGFAGSACSHESSTAYLRMSMDHDQAAMELELNLLDLEAAVGLDRDYDRRITWGEIKAQLAAVQRYLDEGLWLAADGQRCKAGAVSPQIRQRGADVFAVYTWRSHCQHQNGKLRLHYALMGEVDPLHRALLRVDHGATTQAYTLDPADGRQGIALSPVDGRSAATFTQYFHQGVHHILIGWDHLLFLATLVLPSVLLLGGADAGRRKTLAASAKDVGWVVTAFTVAHSISMALSVSGVINLSAWLVESVIAASVVIAALHNLRPIWHRRRVWLAFGFGLVHGLGFAGVLSGLGLPAGAMLTALLGFNLGVEAGQLALLGLAFPVLFLLRGTVFYRRAVYPGASVLIAGIGTVWLVQRLAG